MRIKELRQKAGLSQAEFARNLGYKHQSAVAMLENGTRKIPVDKLPKLAEILGCSIADLFEPTTKGA